MAFPNKAQNGSRLTSANPLFDAIFLEVFHKDRVRRTISVGDAGFTSEIILPEYHREDRFC